MSGKLKHILLPAIAVGLMVVGTNGLKEVAYSATYAETPTYYKSLKTPALTGTSLNNEVKENSPRNELGPSFTFLVHGIGGNASNWSNDLYYDPDSPYTDELGIGGEDYNPIENPTTYYWNDGSLINKILHRSDSALYLARSYGSTSFKFYRYNETLANGTYQYQEVSSMRNTLSETYKHNVVVYESNAPLQSLSQEFANFEHVVNTLCYDYKQYYGFTPKINLVGHSRGGLVVQSYVNKYPYNVDKYFNIGTPYNGTESLDLANTLLDHFGSYINTGEDDDPVLGFTDPAYLDLDNQTLLNGLKNTWNNLKQNSGLLLEGNSYSGVMTLPLIIQMINDACEKEMIPLSDSYVSLVIGMLTDLNNMCVTNYGNSPYQINNLMMYDDYMSVCEGRVSQATRAQMANRIYNTLHTTAYQLVASPMISSYIEEYEDIPVVGGIVHWLGGLVGHFAVDYILSVFRNEIIPIIVNSIESFDGKVGVFNNDVLVDLKSQVAWGYWGQNRYVKVFGADYLQSGVTRPTTRNFLVGHNLETLNNEILEHIMYEADFPNYRELHYDVHDNEKSSLVAFNANNTILSSVKEFTIDGNALGGGTFSANPYIKINSRSPSQPLTIVLKNFRTTVGSSSTNTNYPFIKYLGTSTFNLTIEYEGYNYFNYAYGHSKGTTVSVIDCGKANIRFQPVGTNPSLTLVGSTGSAGTNGASYNNNPRYEIDSDRNGYAGYNGGEGTSGKNGSNCVVCNELDLRYARDLILQGGDGGKGGNGGHGGAGANGKTKALGFKGGDGGNGGNGGRGGRGGNGGYAFSCYKVIMGTTNYSTNHIDLFPGKPGNGGKGGNGGDGGNGANGSYFQILWSVTNHNGGNGGNGGKVGYGGDSGYSYFDGSSIFDISSSNPAMYNEMKNRCGFQYAATGGYCGACVCDAGNAGRRSNAPTNICSGDGTPGKAVNSATSLNSLYYGTTTLYAYANGSRYFCLNGCGRNSSNNYTYYTYEPSYGINGSVVYNYDDNY